jgi:hypothetical protein
MTVAAVVEDTRRQLLHQQGNHVHANRREATRRRGQTQRMVVAAIRRDPPRNPYRVPQQISHLG